MNIRNHPLGYVAGLTAVIGYLVFTTSAYLFYPSAYTPYANWLSDLGNYSQNPAGAILYDIGVSLTGLLIAAFASAILFGERV